MARTHREIVQGFYEAVRVGDMAAATSVFADDLTWVEPPFPGHEGGTFHGKKTVLENVLGPFMRTWSNLRVTPERITETDDGAITHGRYTGAHHESGRAFESRFVHTWTLREEKATRFEMLADTVQFFRAVRPNGAGDIAVSGKTITVDGVDIFYREAGPAAAPTVILLHGFPSSSHMFRNLIPALQGKYHVLAPDYPGFGLSGMPSPKGFAYTFDHLAEVLLHWTDAVGVSDYTLYLQDYGAPVGLRMATARPERVRGLVVQNGNMYLEGLSPALAPLTAYIAHPAPETEAPVRALLTAETTRFQYLHGARNPGQIAPESWVYDQYFLDRKGNDEIQLALFRDYGTNPPLYASWQQYLREHRPPTLVAWGKNDPFFTPAGATSILKDLPSATVHLLDTGHFALEEHGNEIATLMQEFLEANRR